MLLFASVRMLCPYRQATMCCWISPAVHACSLVTLPAIFHAAVTTWYLSTFAAVAAVQVVNHAAIGRFALRGAGQPGPPACVVSAL
jgi:hypothetical protein